MVISFETQILLEFPIPFLKGEHPDHYYLFDDLRFPLQLPFKLHKDNKPANNKDETKHSREIYIRDKSRSSIDDASVWVEVFPPVIERSRSAFAPRGVIFYPPWLSRLVQTA